TTLTPHKGIAGRSKLETNSNDQKSKFKTI
ncbi:unnamed protein product, partial [marine sediment metagenome]